MKKLLLILLLLPAFAAADITFTITAPTLQHTLPGGVPDVNCFNGDLSCLIYSGTITPVGGTDTFINGLQIVFTPSTPELTSNNSFFTAGPPFSAPGFFLSTDPAYSGPVFEIDISLNALPGVYTGTATLFGGPDSPSDNFLLASDTFTLVVDAPEPAALGLTALGLAAFGFGRYRRK